MTIEQLHQRRRDLEGELTEVERAIGRYQREECEHDFRDGWCEKCQAIQPKPGENHDA